MEESKTARLLRQIKEACELVGAKTEEYARISRKRLDVLSISREVHKEKTALGERVYELLRDETTEPIAEDSTVQAILDRLRNLDSSLSDCEQEIATIREAARGRVDDVRRKYEEPRRAPSRAPAERAAAGAGARPESAEASPGAGDAPGADPPESTKAPERPEAGGSGSAPPSP